MAEADISGASIKGSDTKLGSFTAGIIGITGLGSTSVTSEQKVNWLGTVRGRLGITPADHIMFYATGGLAYGHVEASTAASVNLSVPILVATAAGASAASVSDTKAGWAAGAGFEWALSRNWSFKGEWIHWDLGRLSYNSTLALVNPVLFVNATVTTTSTARFDGDIVRAGVNYRF